MTIDNMTPFFVKSLANHAVGALIDEATLTPKPGLVDVRGNGAHHDLSWSLMVHSARVLHPAFAEMATAGACEPDPLRLREQIGQAGRTGEATMLMATRGVNTHRGAIWALGLCITAAAQLLALSAALSPAEITRGAAVLARLPDCFAPRSSGHKGEQACLKYGVGGARGQAAAGFPHVTEAAIPTLQQARHAGLREDFARLNALLSIMATLDDTCILARGGAAALAAVQSGAAAVLALGGPATPDGWSALRRLETDMLSRRLSPGGAADLLAVCLFLDRLRGAHDLALKDESAFATLRT